MPALPSLNSSMKSRACFSITLIASKMLLLKTPWGWGPTSRPAMKQSEDLHLAHVKQLHGCLGNIFNIVPGAIWLNLSETHQQGAWQQSVKWNISKEGVHSAEQDNWPERWLSATQNQQKQELSCRFTKKKPQTPSHSHVPHISRPVFSGPNCERPF